MLFFSFGLLTWLFSIRFLSMDLFSFISFLTLLLLILFISTSSTDQFPLGLAFLVVLSFMVRSLYSYWTFNSMVSPFPDSFEYLVKLDDFKLMSNYSISYAMSAASSLHFSYIYLLYITDKLFSSTYSLLLVNVFLFCVSIPLLYRVVVKDFGKKIATFTIVLILLSSNLLIFTSNILKDGLVFFLTALCLYLYKKNKGSKVLFLLFVFSTLLLIATRIYAGFSILVAIGFDYLINRWKYVRKRNKILMFIFTPIILGVTLFIPTFNRYIDLSIRFLTSHSITDYLTDIPIAIFKMIFSPLPWNMLDDIEHYTLTVTDSIFTLVFSLALVLFMAKWLKYKELRSKTYLYLLPILVHATALGLAYDGNSTRQRVSVIFCIVLLYVIGMFYKPKPKNKSIGITEAQ